jgi:hypothetical protein
MNASEEVDIFVSAQHKPGYRQWLSAMWQHAVVRNGA